MDKPQLHQDDYIAKLNERLQSRALYEEGMRFVAMPRERDGTSVTGFDWQGGRFHRTLFLEVAADVASQFGLLEPAQAPGRPADSGMQHFYQGYHVGSDELMYDYTVRYGAGPTPRWDVHIRPQGGPPVRLAGTAQGNVHAGEGLKAAMAAMVEAMIDEGCCRP